MSCILQVRIFELPAQRPQNATLRSEFTNIEEPNRKSHSLKYHIFSGIITCEHATTQAIFSGKNVYVKRILKVILGLKYLL